MIIQITAIIATVTLNNILDNNICFQVQTVTSKERAGTKTGSAVCLSHTWLVLSDALAYFSSSSEGQMDRGQEEAAVLGGRKLGSEFVCEELFVASGRHLHEEVVRASGREAVLSFPCFYFRPGGRMHMSRTVMLCLKTAVNTLHPSVITCLALARESNNAVHGRICSGLPHIGRISCTSTS